MDIVSFQNMNFKIREVKLSENESVLISTSSLNMLLTDENGGYVTEEAIALDEKIFYFVEKNEIELSEEELKKIINKIAI